MNNQIVIGTQKRKWVNALSFMYLVNLSVVKHTINFSKHNSDFPTHYIETDCACNVEREH